MFGPGAAEEADRYCAEKEAHAALLLIRMGSDPRLPAGAIGYVRDLHSHKTSDWRFLHDRLTMLRRYMPDLIDDFSSAIGFRVELSYCDGCRKHTLHYGPVSQYCEICGATCGDFA